MYYDYYGFNQPPFRITPDTSLFYPGGDRGAILDALLYAIRNGEGIVKVVGEVGSGKTMLCRMLEKELPDNVEVVYLANPSIAPENTLHAIAFELKLGIHPGTSRFEVMNELQQYLLKRHSENRQVVVFVEEAQSMPIATLEEIRLLSNLETRQSKLLQIVLFGQPELDENISRPEIRQLKERITYSFELAPFKTNDIHEYLNARVRACGFRAGELFEPAALRLIEGNSRGLLRRINILADKSLLAAYSDNSRMVRAKHARMAVRDSEFMSRQSRVTRPVLLALALGIAGTAAAGAFIDWFLRTEWIGTPAVSIGAADSAAAFTPPTAGTRMREIAEQASAGTVAETADQPASGIPAVAPAALVPARIPGDPGLSVDDGEPAQSGVTPPDPPTAGGTTGADTTPDGYTEHAKWLINPPAYRLQESPDTRSGVAEIADLQRQLLQLPPEAAEAASINGDYGCDYCWTIIYRPVRSGEKF